MSKSEEIEKLFGILSRIFALQKREDIVDILTKSDGTVKQIPSAYYWHESVEKGNPYIREDDNYLEIEIDFNIYQKYQSHLEEIQKFILTAIWDHNLTCHDRIIAYVKLKPTITDIEEWRNKANKWLQNSYNLSNQGRVRSDNIAPIEKDGLLFRSQSEINLYLALKDRGVLFAPLPTFLIGGKEYLRVEPDFIIIYNGIMALVEIDGDNYHHETPSQAHKRTSVFQINGVHILRYNANECETIEKSRETAESIMAKMTQIKNSRT